MKQLFFILSFLIISCSSNDKIQVDETIRGADISYLPLIESEGIIFKNNNQPENVITTLKKTGCNYIRIRLWHTPSDVHSSLTEVKALAERVREAGMKVWITVHYSDTWADPGNQTKPIAWQNLNFNELKIAVSNYTANIVSEINPDIIQIGNETNDGFLWPTGRLSINENQYIQLTNAATIAVRANSNSTKIMFHYAGFENSSTYFTKMNSIDYDYIGLSYYPIWHGKNLNDLKNSINQLGTTFNKKVIIAETAYPFSLGYNDFTNNILGQIDQIITAYPPTPIGQKNFLNDLKNTVKVSDHGIGFCYWGAEWIAFRGPTANNGSPWENQALWDFDNNALPALEFFKKY
ncbi:MAG: glycosyl hydrolase 53 family protein [Flavobacterium sp.]|nr:glycosyl hydrolase 53 family protein [Flavobacterium sp.]